MCCNIVHICFSVIKVSCEYHYSLWFSEGKKINKECFVVIDSFSCDILKGRYNCWEHGSINESFLNRKIKRPLKPKVTIQIASSGDSNSIPKPIQILAARLCEDQRLLLVYGNYLKPMFEKVVRSAREYSWFIKVIEWLINFLLCNK
jgi:hypothetical protein